MAVLLATRDAQEVLNSEFLQIRCTILDLAAALDRLDRAPDHPGQHPDPRLCQINQALEALLVHDVGRAETVQRIFSLEYDPDWQTKFGHTQRRA
jgi:hypothetical protein